MVMTKRAATDLATGPGRLGSRTARSAWDPAGRPQRAPPIQFKPVRRPDQRSAVSIAGSCATRSAAGSTGRWTPAGGGRAGSGCSGDSGGGQGRFRAKAATQRSQPPSRPSACGGRSGDVGSGSVGGGGRFRFTRRNSGASNSVRSNSQQRRDLAAAGFGDDLLVDDADDADAFDDADADAGLPAGWRHHRSGRRSFGTQRLGKTVSITASQEARTRSDIDRTASSRMYMPSQSEVATKSIIKLRPLPPSDLIVSTHNEDGTMKESRAETGLTPHQLREQKIFGECRFIPCDTFYKKVVVAPNRDRQFFAAPRCSRVPGSRMLYDIANQNSRHHQDCNFDTTRDMLKKACPTYCRPSQFRHIY